MVRLFRPGAQDAESARLQTYQRLCRLYERQGRTAPEFLGRDELGALSPATWRGLFVSGELDAVPELIAAEPVIEPANDTDWWKQNV